MSMLNSVILEGRIKSYTKNDGFIDFVVASSRYSMNENNERIETITEVSCRVFGAMQSPFERVAEIGRGVRVVGHLAGSDGSIVLVCEHIEWKFSQKNKEANYEADATDFSRSSRKTLFARGEKMIAILEKMLDIWTESLFCEDGASELYDEICDALAELRG